MRLLHEHAAVQQRHLDERHHQAADQFARTAFQIALVQHHVEQHADQVDGILVDRRQARRGGIHAQLHRAAEHFVLQALRQGLAGVADGGAQRGAGGTLQQRQHRQHLALRQVALRMRRTRGLVLHVTATARFLQQVMQRLQQDALCAGRGGVTGRHLAEAGGLRAGMCGLQATVHARHAVEEARRPGRGARLLVGDQVLQLARSLGPGGTARRWLRRGTAAEPLVERRVDPGDRRDQVAFAQLDHHQPDLRGQVAGREGLVDRHADVFGTDGIQVAVQRHVAGDPAEPAIQSQEHRLAVALDDAGQVAHRQPGFEFLVRHQGQGVVRPLCECGLHREGLSLLQGLPGALQVGAEAHDDVFATATQLAHGIQERHLRRARALGAVEQGVVEPAQRHGEGVHQRRDRRVARLVEQARVAPGAVRDIEDVRHAQGLRPGGRKAFGGCGPGIRHDIVGNPPHGQP